MSQYYIWCNKDQKPGYKELDIFLSSIRGLNPIPKTMIFVDSNNKEIVLIEYLCTKVLDNLKDKTEQVIQCFYSDLSDKSKEWFAEDFF